MNDDRMEFARYFAAQKGSEIGDEATAVNRGSFAKYMDGPGDRVQGAFASLQAAPPMPDSGNEELSQAMQQKADTFLNGFLQQGTAGVSNTLSRTMGTGFAGLSTAQQTLYAKQLAALKADAAKSDAAWGALGAGVGVLGAVDKKNKWWGTA